MLDMVGAIVRAPTPSVPLPIFRPTQYNAYRATLTFKQADARYYKGFVSPQYSDIIAPNEFGVTTLRLGNTKLAGFSNAGAYQLDLIDFDLTPGESIIKLKSAPASPQYSPQYSSVLELTPNACYVKTAIGGLSKAYYPPWNTSLVNRMLNTAVSLGNISPSFFPGYLPRVVYVGTTSTGRDINRFYMCGGEYSVSLEPRLPSGNRIDSNSNIASAQLSDLIYSHSRGRLYYSNLSTVGGQSTLYYTTPNPFGGSGLSPVPIGGTNLYHCIAENLVGRMVVLGVNDLANPTQAVSAVCDEDDSGLTAWTTYSITFIVATRVCYSLSLDSFVAVSNFSNPNVGISQDGINWTVSTVGTATKFADVCYSPELDLLVAVCSSHTTANRVFTSRDAVNWTERVTPNSNAYVSVRWLSYIGLFIAVSKTGTSRMMTSPDGINWTAQPLIQPREFTDVAFNPRQGYIFFAHALSDSNLRSAWVGLPYQKSVDGF